MQEVEPTILRRLQNAARNENATPADMVKEFESLLSGYIRTRRERLFGQFFANKETRHQGLVPETRAVLNELKVLEEALFGIML